MIKTSVLRAAVLAAAMAAGHAQAADTRKVDVPAGDLASALETLARQAGVEFVYEVQQVKGLRTRGVHGELTTENAVSKLLEGTKLTITKHQSGAILISAGGAPVKTSGTVTMKVAQASDTQEQDPRAGASTSAQGSSDTPAGTAADASQNEITVTGTQIRGAQPSSPVVTITQEEMRLSGYTNLGEAVRALPQNFSGGQNPGVLIGGISPNANFTGSSSLNLRGLGPDATLTLLNGTRLPYDGTIQAIDVSVIPLSAIDRMEVLLDGASAIYGSDAVGGVANIILKRDYQGIEASARYGAATDGGFEQQQYNAIGGTAWRSGGFLLTADLSKNTPVFARQRDYLAGLPNGNVTLYPENRQQSALFSGHQSLGATAEFAMDAFYTDRDTYDLSQTVAVFLTQRDAIIWGFTPSLRFDLPHDWSARLHGTVGRNENTAKLRGFSTAGVELPVASPVTQYLNETKTADVSVDGPLFALPGGRARVSLGAGYRANEFEQFAVVANRTEVRGDTSSQHAYAEINLPLAARFTLNGALRYEDDDTFGDVTTPKAGFIWEALPGFDLKASWGKSYKAPTLTQLYSARTLYLYPSIFIPGLPAGTAAMLASGGNPDLTAERSEVMTAGFVARPAVIPGLTLEFNWFDIDYTSRVLAPIANIALATTPIYADFVTLNPTVQQQNAAFAAAGFSTGAFTSNLTGGAYNPATVSGILRNNYANVSADTLDGVDLTARYTMDLAGGRLVVATNGSWIDGVRQLTSLAPDFASAGTNFYPAKFKGRAGVTWMRGGFTVSSALNHLDGITNTNFAARTHGGSMTTVDLVFVYEVATGPLTGVGFNLATMNLFDSEPPYLRPSQAFYPPFDSTNYSPLGRTIGLTVSKRL